jgi:CubicO group peptidase (beta-lactamase class C family)
LNENIELKKIIDESSHKVGLSGVVYVKKGNVVVSESAYDYANRVEELPNTIHTRFGIASGCKLFTAIGICQLVEKGVLSFDTPLKECLDIHFPHFSKSITIHHLLTHTSGIPDYFDEEIMDDYEDLWKEKPVYHMKSLKDFLPLFQSNKMKFEPGERFHYNNAGYILLGLIIEQQTNKGFADYIESEVFQKADMERSGYFSMDELPRNTAMGYIHNKEENTWRTNIYSIPAKGGSDGGAFTTAPDMIKLWESLFDFTLLNEDTTRKLLTPHVLVKGEVHYGYGIWMNKKNEDIYKYHVMGYDPGVSFRASIYPDIHLKVVIPSNNESDPFDITKAIEDYFLN